MEQYSELPVLSQTFVMDNPNDFFSAETLSVLEEDDEMSRSPLSRKNLILSQAASDQNSYVQTQPKHRKRRAAPEIPGCSTINLGNAKRSKPKRKNFEPKRREEVANVRKVGACMKRRQLKISVSFDIHRSIDYNADPGRASVLEDPYVEPVFVPTMAVVTESQKPDV